MPKFGKKEFLNKKTFFFLKNEDIFNAMPLEQMLSVTETSSLPLGFSFLFKKKNQTPANYLSFIICYLFYLICSICSKMSEMSKNIFFYLYFFFLKKKNNFFFSFFQIL